VGIGMKACFGCVVWIELTLSGLRFANVVFDDCC